MARRLGDDPAHLTFKFSGIMAATIAARRAGVEIVTDISAMTPMPNAA